MQRIAQKPERDNQNQTEYDGFREKHFWSEPSASATAPFDATLSPAMFGARVLARTTD
jgi:hypothetical protein